MAGYRRGTRYHPAFAPTCATFSGLPWVCIMPSVLPFCSLTATGYRRSENEDACLDMPEYGIWAVADGMGGHGGGARASALAIESMRTAISAGVPLEAAISRAHQQILQEKQRQLCPPDMGTTIVAAGIDNNILQIAWAGDSRAYLWQRTAGGGELQCLTTDHSYTQALVDAGVLSDSERNQHPEHNTITRCLGWAAVPLAIDTLNQPWSRQHLLLLCSDGLTRELTDTEIATLLCRADNCETAAQTLLASALEHGGGDNITLQIIAGPEAFAAPAPAQPAPRKRRWYLPALLISLLAGVACYWFLL